MVSVLVPARNEALNIAACITSLLEQDYPDFEVIVLNDNSTDETPGILARLSKSHPRLQVLHGSPLPEDWHGKNWACRQLDQAATGELILFTDADTRHTPDMLRASVSALLAEGADLVTAFPREEVVTWGERLMIPIIGWGIFTFIPIRLAQRVRWPVFSITIGQFMLFRRAAYDLAGGYSAVKTSVVDDIFLGRHIIASGGEWRLLNGTRHVSCRMYRGFGEAVGGLCRSLFAVFDYRILPYLFGCLMVGLVSIVPLLVLILPRLRYMLQPLPVQYVALSETLTILSWLLAYRRFQFPIYLALWLPVCVPLFIAVAVRSFLQTAVGRENWKGRLLERTGMHWL